MIPPGAGETHFEGELVAGDRQDRQARARTRRASLTSLAIPVATMSVPGPRQRGDGQWRRDSPCRRCLLLGTLDRDGYSGPIQADARDTPEWAGQAALRDRHADFCHAERASVLSASM